MSVSLTIVLITADPDAIKNLLIKRVGNCFNDVAFHVEKSYPL